jgi:hypothetical protein
VDVLNSRGSVLSRTSLQNATSAPSSSITAMRMPGSASWRAVVASLCASSMKAAKSAGS